MGKTDDPHEKIRKLNSDLTLARQELERLKKTAADSRLAAIGERLSQVPKITWLLIQQSFDARDQSIGPEPGAPGVKRVAWKRKNVFRCLITTTGKQCADRNGDTLREAVTDAFDAVGLLVPTDIDW